MFVYMGTPWKVVNDLIAIGNIVEDYVGITQYSTNPKVSEGIHVLLLASLD